MMTFMIVLFLIGLVPASWASGPTSEDEYIRDFTSGRYPLTLSGDGRWRFHTDDLKRLHRVSIETSEKEQSVELPEVARNLSASYSGEKLAFSTFGGCIGVVTYTDTTATTTATATTSTTPTLDRIQWLEYDEKTADYQRDYCLNGDGDTKPGQGNYQVAAPVGLSSDGKRIALKTPAAVVIVDLATRKIIDQFPAELDDDSKSVFSLQWLDHDTKLLVTKLMLGEGWESQAEGSNVQVSVVDVATKKRIQHFETELSGTLPYYQLLWAFSEETGLLFGMDGEMYKDNPVLFSFNLKSCTAVRQPVLAASQKDWIDFTADPHGRWIAVVEMSGRNDESVAPRPLQLVLHSVADGKRLAAWPLPTRVRSLQPSADGNWLYATTSGEKSGNYDDPYKGGGEVLTFNVASKMTGLDSKPAMQWPDQSCAVNAAEKADASSLPFGVFPAEALQKEGITILATAEPAADGWHALVCNNTQCVLRATPMTVITKLVRSKVKAGDVTLAAGEKPLVLLRGKLLSGKPFTDGQVVPTYLSELMPPSIIGPTLGTLGAIIKTPSAGDFQVVPRLLVNAPAPVEAVAPSTTEGNQQLTAQETDSGEGSAEGEGAVPPEKIVNLYLEQGTQRQLLFSFDYKALVAMVSNSEFSLVLWAGDVDGDGKLDLVTRQPVGEMYAGSGIGQYTFTHLQLWLSSVAGKDEIVGQAATLDPAQENADDMGM